MTKWLRCFLPILILFIFLYFNREFDTSKKFQKFQKISKFEEKDEKCRPSSNILFLKTHKTASSTIQNIFFRYGIRNKLWFAMPIKSNVHLLGKSK